MLRHAVLAVSCAAFVVSAACNSAQSTAVGQSPQTSASGPAAPPPTWSWSDEEVRQFWSRIGHGPRLTPPWPGGAAVAVAISFDYQMGTIYDPQNAATSVNTNSMYDGRVGLRRVLELLDKQQVPASFYVTAVTAKFYSETLKQIMASGRHEIGVHGWIHERTRDVPPEEERRLLKKSIDLLQATTGRTPVGYRSPAWEFSDATLGLLLEFGFLYDSGMMADDDPYEILLDGKPTGLIEIPVEWIRDDAPHFRRDSPLSPDDVFQIWRAEFDKAYEERGVFQLTTHPRIIGHRSRILMLDRLITYIKGHKGVWFATHEQVARHVQQSRRATSD